MGSQPGIYQRKVARPPIFPGHCAIRDYVHRHRAANAAAAERLSRLEISAAGTRSPTPAERAVSSSLCPDGYLTTRRLVPVARESVPYATARPNA